MQFSELKQILFHRIPGEEVFEPEWPSSGGESAPGVHLDPLGPLWPAHPLGTGCHPLCASPPLSFWHLRQTSLYERHVQ